MHSFWLINTYILTEGWLSDSDTSKSDSDINVWLSLTAGSAGLTGSDVRRLTPGLTAGRRARKSESDIWLRRQTSDSSLTACWRAHDLESDIWLEQSDVWVSDCTLIVWIWSLRSAWADSFRIWRFIQRNTKEILKKAKAIFKDLEICPKKYKGNPKEIQGILQQFGDLSKEIQRKS